jgi:hypothetical protein
MIALSNGTVIVPHSALQSALGSGILGQNIYNACMEGQGFVAMDQTPASQ